MKVQNVKFEKENRQIIASFFFSINLLSWTSTIHPGVFLGQAFKSDSVSDMIKFKPVRTGENLALNYER